MGKPNGESVDDKKEALELKCKEFPNSKVLLISSKRPGAFLIRTASELLAGGTEVLILSALGDAMPLAIQLQMALLNKSAATTIKIETSLNKRVNSRSKHDSYTPGLQIYMRKHPEFKGSRISLGHVSFALEPKDGPYTPLFEFNPTERTCALVSGSAEMFIGGSGTNGQLAQLLTHAGHSLDAYQSLFKELLQDAKRANEADPNVFVSTMTNCQVKHPDLKFCLCRLPRNAELVAGDEGVVFVCIFTDKFPYDQPNNMGFVYLVAPNGKSYADVADFYAALYETGENLMTALCDYNGIVKRGGFKTLLWLTTCRVCLVGGGINKHNNATKLEVAKQLLNGIAEGYRHGPAPRVCFGYDEDAFRQAWTETTGLKAPTASSGGAHSAS